MQSRSTLLLPFALLLSTSLPFLAAYAQQAHDGPAKAIERAQTIEPFDVVSIKENKSAVENGSYNIDDRGIYTATNLPLWAIVAFAYDVKQDQIISLDGPVSSARFDLTAKDLPADNGQPVAIPDHDMQAKVILALQDRFHLKAHLQPSIRPVYDLLVVKGGSKLKLSQDEINSNNWYNSAEGANKVLTGKNVFLSDIASRLADEVHRPVIDKTGLTGHGDIVLKWSDDVAATQGGTNVISIFTAVEEQLGLKLQPSKGPVDMIVIDHVEMPSAN